MAFVVLCSVVLWIQLIQPKSCVLMTGPLIVAHPSKTAHMQNRISLFSNWDDIKQRFSIEINSLSLIVTTDYPITVFDLKSEKELSKILQQNDANHKHFIVFPSVMSNPELDKLISTQSNRISKASALKLLQTNLSHVDHILLANGNISNGRVTRPNIKKRQADDNDEADGRIIMQDAYLYELDIDNRVQITRYIPALPDGAPIINGSIRFELIAAEDENHRIAFNAGFRHDKMFWYLNNSFLTTTSSESGDNREHVLFHVGCSYKSQMQTPLDYSYVCQNGRFEFEDRENSSFIQIDLSRLQLQPFKYKDNQFGPTSDCSCFMTAAMWMGLIYFILFFVFIYWAVSYLSDIEAPTRFADVEVKQIPVPDQ